MNLGQVTDCTADVFCGFPTSFTQVSGNYFQLHYNHFLPQLYKFITYHHNFQQCIGNLTLFNISTRCTSLFLLRASVTSVLCYINHFQGATLITCTKPSAYYCVLCMINQLCYRQRKAYCEYPWLRNAHPQPCHKY